MNPDEPQRRIYNEGPQIESTVTLSKSGRALIHRTVITHVKPVAYYEAILRNANKEAP
jgi:hypothetical protein